MAQEDEGLIQRLFDQLEKAMDKVDDGMSILSTAISEMLDILKHSTTNEDVVFKIAEHSKKVSPTVDVANRIYETCKLHGDDVNSINKHIGILKHWVWTMIITVVVTFSLLSVSYLYTKSSINTLVKSEVSRSSEIDVNHDDDIQLLIKKIDILQQKVNEEVARSEDHRKKGELLNE
jgi:hypothetical protein